MGCATSCMGKAAAAPAWRCLTCVLFVGAVLATAAVCVSVPTTFWLSGNDSGGAGRSVHLGLWKLCLDLPGDNDIELGSGCEDTTSSAAFDSTSLLEWSRVLAVLWGAASVANCVMLLLTCVCAGGCCRLWTTLGFAATFALATAAMATFLAWYNDGTLSFQTIIDVFDRGTNVNNLLDPDYSFWTATAGWALSLVNFVLSLFLVCDVCLDCCG